MGGTALALTRVFLCGALAHRTVLGALGLENAPAVDATIEGWRLVAPPGAALTGLAPGAGTVRGLVFALPEPDEGRLRFLATALGLVERAVWPVADGAGVAEALALAAPDGNDAPDWDGHDWDRRWSATLAAAIADIAALEGRADPALVALRLPQMLTRAGARVRAGAAGPGPVSLRREAGKGDVSLLDLGHPYGGFFAVEEMDLVHRRFDGSLSPPLRRAVFLSGDASVVLPYDPVRDRVMLIEQFRVGPYARGAPNPWMLEAIAGRIDGGETPEQAALREAVEEAGLSIRALIPGPRFYPTPGAKAEYLYTYIGLADLADLATGTGGLADEAEDIRSHVLPFARLMDLLASGEIDNAPLMLIALWLDRERPRLRGA